MGIGAFFRLVIRLPGVDREIEQFATEQVARTAAFAVRVSSLVRRGEAHGDDEVSIRTKGRRNFDTALQYSAVDMIATVKTRTAKSAVRATC